MNFDFLIDMLIPLNAYVLPVLQVLGMLVIVGLGVDKLIPDEKDGGFMSKVFGIPVVGAILSSVKRFSPLNVKEEEKK